MSPAPRLETERLILRGWREDDLDGFAAMMAEPAAARFLTADQRPMDRAQAWRAMAVFAGHWGLLGCGMFVLEHKETGEFVGRVGPWRPEGWPGFELGWGLATRFWGKGYATEAARTAGDWAFAQFRELDGVISLIHVENLASQRVAQRLGEAPGPKTLHAGMPHVIWRVSRAQWAAARASPRP